MREEQKVEKAKTTRKLSTDKPETTQLLNMKHQSNKDQSEFPHILQKSQLNPFSFSSIPKSTTEKSADKQSSKKKDEVEDEKVSKDPWFTHSKSRAGDQLNEYLLQNKATHSRKRNQSADSKSSRDRKNTPQLSLIELVERIDESSKFDSSKFIRSGSMLNPVGSSGVSSFTPPSEHSVISLNSPEQSVPIRHVSPQQKIELSRVVEESKEHIRSAGSVESFKQMVRRDPGLMNEKIISAFASEESKERLSRPQSDVSPSLDSDKREVLNSARIISSVSRNSSIFNICEHQEDSEPEKEIRFPSIENNLNRDEQNVEGYPGTEASEEPSTNHNNFTFMEDAPPPKQFKPREVRFMAGENQSSPIPSFTFQQLNQVRQAPQFQQSLSAQQEQMRNVLEEFKSIRDPITQPEMQRLVQRKRNEFKASIGETSQLFTNSSSSGNKSSQNSQIYRNRYARNLNGPIGTQAEESKSFTQQSAVVDEGRALNAQVEEEKGPFDHVQPASAQLIAQRPKFGLIQNDIEESKSNSSSSAHRGKQSVLRSLSVIPEEQFEQKKPLYHTSEETKEMPARSQVKKYLASANTIKLNSKPTKSEPMSGEKFLYPAISSDSQQEAKSVGSKQDLFDQKYQFTFKASSNKESSDNEAEGNHFLHPSKHLKKKTNSQPFKQKQSPRDTCPYPKLEINRYEKRSNSISEGLSATKRESHTPGFRQHGEIISIGSEQDSIEEIDKNANRSKSEDKGHAAQTKRLEQGPVSGNVSAKNKPIEDKLGPNAKKKEVNMEKYTEQQQQAQPTASKAERTDNQRLSQTQPGQPFSSLNKQFLFENFGHGRRNNLKSKAEEIQRGREFYSQASEDIKPHYQIEYVKLEKKQSFENNQEEEEEDQDEEYYKKIKRLQERRDYSYEDSSSSNFLERLHNLCGDKQPNEVIQTMMRHMRMIQQLPLESEGSNTLQQSQPPSSINKPSSGKAYSERHSYKQGYSSFDENNTISTKNQLLRKPGKNGFPSMMSSSDPSSSIRPLPSQQTKQLSISNLNKSIHTNQTLNIGNPLSSASDASPHANQSPRSGRKRNSSSKERLSRIQSSTQQTAPPEKFESYYAKLKSLVAARETSKDAAELVEILKAWEDKTHVECPVPFDDLFDGSLEILIFDVKTCRLQMSKQNLADFATQVSQRTNCGEHDCNRNQTIVLQTGTLEPQNWVDILKLNKNQPVVGPEVELCRCIAEMLGAKVLMQPKSDKRGHQFNISMPVLSVKNQ